MPIDVRCPGCAATFPVTEAAAASAVECPFCEYEFTAALDRSAPPDLAPWLAAENDTNGSAEPKSKPKSKPKPKPAAKRRRDDEDDDFDIGRASHDTGGSPWLVIAVGGAGLLCAFAALGALVYTMFPAKDKEREAAAAVGTAPAGTPFAKPKTDPPPPPPSVSFNPNAPTVPTPFAKQPAPKDAGPNPNRPDPKVNPRPAVPKFDRPKIEPPVPGGFALTPVPGKPVPITPTELAGNGHAPLTVGLPGKVGDVAVGGGGRYLVFHFPDKKQFAVFDVCTARVVREMDAIAPDVVFAAGMNRLVVASAENRVLNQYALPGLEPEGGGTPPGGDKKVIAVAMGSATNGPLFVATFPELMLFDPDKREVVEGSVKFGTLGAAPLHPRVQLRASADGTTVTATWPMGATVGPAGVATVRGGKWVDAPVPYPHPAPAADGQTLFTEGYLFGPDGKGLGPRVGGLSPGGKAWLVPAVTGTTFVKLSQKQSGAGPKARWPVTATIHADRDPKTVLTTVGEVPEAEELPLAPAGAEGRFDKHVFLIPEARVLAIIPPARDRIVLRRIGVK